MSINERIASGYETHLDALVQRLIEYLRRTDDAGTKKFTDEQLRSRASAPFLETIKWLRGDRESFMKFSKEAIKRRAAMPNFTSAEVGEIGQAMYEMLVNALPDIFPDDELLQAQARAVVAELTFASNRAGYEGFVEVRQEQLQRREEELSTMQDEFEQLSTTLRELAAPIAPIHDNVLVLPLVGNIDTNRAQSLTESLLETIVSRQSDLVILDITGVPVVDTNIANYLLQTTRAVNLLGAQVILVGISAEVAQTIVGLDLDLRQLTVRANLQDGIEYALALLGLGIRPLDDAA